MSDSGLLIHIGYHKTATTWLQRRVFSDERSGFQLLHGKQWAARRLLLGPTSLAFDPAAARQHFSDGIATALNQGFVPVISDERLSGNPHSGGYDSKENAERLHRTFPEGRVVIVVRRQPEMIYSVYDQYVQEGGGCTIEDYLSPPRSRLCMPTFRIEYFQYHRLIERYMALFGRERVKVFPYELLRRSPDEYLRELMQFAGNRAVFAPDSGRRINVGRSAFVNAVTRRLNPLLVRDDLNGYSIYALPKGRYYFDKVSGAVARHVPQALDRRVENRVRTVIAAACAGTFGASNRITSELTGLDLGEFGYDVS